MTLTDFCRVIADNEGIICIDLKDNTRIGVVELEELMTNIGRLNRVYSSPLMVRVGNYNSIDKQARDLLVQRKKDTLLSACAFVVNCPASTVATDMFLKMYQPNFPCGVFKSEKQAKKWIRSFAIALN